MVLFPHRKGARSVILSVSKDCCRPFRSKLTESDRVMPAPDIDLVTKGRKLRTGSSPWAKPSLSPRPLTESVKADVVVVGAGITGAFVAEALSRRGVNAAPGPHATPLSKLHERPAPSLVLNVRLRDILDA